MERGVFMSSRKGTTRRFRARSSRETFRTFLETLVGDDAEILSRVRMDDVLDRIEGVVAQYPALIALGVEAALLALEWGTLPVLRTRCRFSRLSREERLRYLDTWEYSAFVPRRNAHVLLKMTGLTALLRETELLESLGYGTSMRHRMERPPEGETAPCPKAVAS